MAGDRWQPVHWPAPAQTNILNIVPAADTVCTWLYLPSLTLADKATSAQKSGRVTRLHACKQTMSRWSKHWLHKVAHLYYLYFYIWTGSFQLSFATYITRISRWWQQLIIDEHHINILHLKNKPSRTPKKPSFHTPISSRNRITRNSRTQESKVVYAPHLTKHFVITMQIINWGDGFADRVTVAARFPWPVPVFGVFRIKSAWGSGR